MKVKSSLIAGVAITFVMLTLIITVYRNQSIEALGKIVPISKIDTNEKVVAIVCNVYEGNEELNGMLKVLEERKIKISFFIGGVWAERNKDMLIKIKNSGHDIQNHGYFHKLPSTLSREKNIKEITETENLIYNITGIRTNLFEPPSGDFNELTLDITNSLGYKTVIWSIDTIDWRKDATRELIMKRVKNKLHPGGIILMHPKPVTANSLMDILDYLESCGYRVITVSDLIKIK